MKSLLEGRLRGLVDAGQGRLLAGGLKGLEKESLRLAADASLAQTVHPVALGSALTHPWITTDYSEALIELITPAFPDAKATLEFLERIHTFVYSQLGDEFLLATSMPIGINGEESIPIARYGRSNIGRMKHVYRRGLAYRYGRTMQSIAGVHFNYSANQALWPVLWEMEGGRGALTDFVNDIYFAAIRNVHRFGWLLIYLFGCSPAVCRSFFGEGQAPPPHFEVFDRDTLYRPYATSLRMSDIGYRNDSQSGLDISFDSLDEYVASLTAAINQPYPPYQRIGVKVAGDYRQLNANILQIENEYYSSIRPKQEAYSGEKPTFALKRRGVRYLELRALDLCCEEPAGVGLDQIRFLETFMLFCLLAESPPLATGEKAETARNGLAVACCGRTPGFELWRRGEKVDLRDWAEELMEGLGAVAEILDGDAGEQPYRRSLGRYRPAIADPESTPAARMLAEMRCERESFAEYARRWSMRHAEVWRKRTLTPEQADVFEAEAEISWENQRRIEAADVQSFDEFLEAYFAQTLS